MALQLAVEFLLKLIYLREVIMVGENEKIVKVIAVPLGHSSGRAVPVGIEGMGVGIAFKPLEFTAVVIVFIVIHGLSLACGRDRDQEICAGEEKRQSVKINKNIHLRETISFELKACRCFPETPSWVD